MFKLLIVHNNVNKFECDIDIREYNEIMKYLLRTLPNDIQSKVPSASKLAKKDSNNEDVPCAHES